MRPMLAYDSSLPPWIEFEDHFTLQPRTVTMFKPQNFQVSYLMARQLLTRMCVTFWIGCIWGFFLQVNFQFVSKKEKKRKDREVCHKRMVYVIMTKWDRDIIILNYVFLLASHIHTQILKVQLPDLNTWSLFTSSLSTHWNDG